tara:strand:+ start:2484 stop:3068 length:585 start_codon:yes stop_codon:yes gene_type:complete
MKKSELKEIIKAEFLSEDEDSKKGNEDEQKRMEGAIRDDRDHIKNLEKDVKDNEDKLSKLKKDETEDVSEAVEDDIDVDVEDNVDVDVEDDIDIDDVSDKSEIEVDSELAGEDADVSAILGLLTKAQEEAKNLGDEKLMDQIGNTITYYTRAHVVAEDGRTDAEEEGYKDGMEDEKEDLNEEVARFKKLAGLIK